MNERTQKEQLYFWNLFSEKIIENGEPFHISYDHNNPRHYATINKNSPSSSFCLSMDFLLHKSFLRIGIYINDDIHTHFFDRLFLSKNEIEEALGFTPLWINRGAQNLNTRRIAVELPFFPYNHNDYDRLIDEALPIIIKYIEVFTIYLPELFMKGNVKTPVQNFREIVKHNIFGIGKIVSQDNETISVLFDDGKKREFLRDTAKNFLEFISQEECSHNPIAVLKRSWTNSFGGKAQTIYDHCCESFGWDKSQRWAFGPQQILYAEGASPEGFSPWFLPHSNLSETLGGNWFNIVTENTVEELWITPKHGLHHDYTTRITFIKTKSNGYVFLGLYHPTKVEEKLLDVDIVNKKGLIIKKAGEKVWIKHYELLDDIYPQQE